MPIALLPIILQLFTAGVKMAPSIIAAGKLELDQISGEALTADEQTRLDTALELAHRFLMAAQPAA